MDQILTGNVTLECPDHIKIVRIFTSSTFTDTKYERNYLMEKVYPKLRDYCAEKGYQFQVVDMRWGMRDVSTYHQLTTELCLKELALCKKLSTGPYLVAFISHKYGWRPPPRIIEKRFFEKFLKETKNTEDGTFLSRWYKEDENRLDSAYILQPVGDVLSDIHSSDKEEKKRAENQWWGEELPNLQKIIRSLAKKLLSSEEAHSFLRSVTETEIRRSVFEDNSVEDHCLWFKRTIHKIDHSSKEAKYFQENPNGADKESQDLLLKLKEDMSKKLGDNVLSYEIEWTEKGVDPENKEHCRYLEKLGNDFEHRVKKLIEKGIDKKDIAKKDMTNSDKELYEEVMQHTLFCKEKCKYFVGRVDILERIQEYVQGGTTDPLIVHGESGSGKTSIMAKAAMEISEKTNGRAVIILRFIGTTLHSSDADSIMESIIRQIQHNYDYPEPISTKYSELKEQFHKSLKQGTAGKPLFVILDALDQQNNCKLDWLMNKEPLPQYTKLILSTLPEGNCLAPLKSCMQELKVGHLKQEDAEKIFDQWLEVNGRTLTGEQRQIVLQAYYKCPLPLFLKLSFDIAKNWHSYSHDCEKDLKQTVRDNINNLFERMEKTHGKILISHTLGHISLAKNGISSQELEDVLSCDEEVLDDCLQYWTPPIRRLPPLLLFRILDDLREYLVYRGSDGIQVINWYHRQFIEAAKERYCSDQEKKKDLYSQLADYFSGKWAGNEKPFKDKNGSDNNCDRLVAKQPIKFGEKPNLRKLNNLPHLLVEAKEIERLKDEALLNLKFLTTKIKATSLREVINDFLFACERFPQNEAIRNVSVALYFSRFALKHDLDQLPTQLLGRLPDIQELHPLIETCRELPHFKPDQNLLYQSDTKLVLRLRNRGNNCYDQFDLSTDKRILVSTSYYNDCVKIYSFPDGDLILEYYPSVPSMYQVQFCDDDQLVAVNLYERIDFIFTKTASFSHSLDKIWKGFFQVCGEKKSLIIFLSSDWHLIIRDIKTKEEKHRIKLSYVEKQLLFDMLCYPSYANNQFFQTAGSDKYVVLLMNTESPKILAVNLQTGCVRRWHINQFHSTQRDDNNCRKSTGKRIALCPNNDLLYLAGDKYLLSYNLLKEIGDEEWILLIYEFPYYKSEIAISTDGQFVCFISKEKISIYNCHSKEKVTNIFANGIAKDTVCMIDSTIVMARLFSGDLFIWDCTRGFKKPDIEVTSPQVPDGMVHQVIFLPNYRYLLFRMEANCYVYDVSKGEILVGFKLITHNSNFDVCPISNTKIVGKSHGELIVMDFERCSISKVFTESSDPDFIKSIKDGKEILTACKGSPDIRVYNTETGRLVQRIEGIYFKEINNISISKSGNIAVLNTISDTEECKFEFCIIDLNRYELKYTLKTKDIPSCSFICYNYGMVQVSRDGTLLIVVREDYNRHVSIVIWNIEQEKVQWETSDHKESFYKATFVRNDEFVLSAGKGIIKLFSKDSGKLLKKIDMENDLYTVPIISPNENPAYFLTEQDYFLCLWSLDSFQKICSIETDNEWVNKIRLSPTGDVIVCNNREEGPSISLLKYSKSNPDVFLEMEEIKSFKELGFDKIIELPFNSVDSNQNDQLD